MAGSYPSIRAPGAATGSFAGIRHFFRWWGRELVGLVPARLRPYPRAASGFVWMEADERQAVFRRYQKSGAQEIGRIDLASQADPAARKLEFDTLIRRHRRHPIGIAIPADRVLRKRIVLPAMARANLRQVLGFELGRHTPFNADQAHFDHRELGVDPGHAERFGVELTVAARRPIDESLALLRAWGREAATVTPIDEIIGIPRYANLLPPHARPATSWLTWLGYAVMALVTLALIAGAFAVPLWQKREVAIALIAQVGPAKQKAAAIEDLRQELERVTADYRYPLERKYARPAAVALIEETTRLLPDDTWLNQLEIKGHELIVHGETGSSTGLIRLFEKSRLTEDAAFRSPLVKGRNNLERFQLAARLKVFTLEEVVAAQKAEAEAREKAKAEAAARRAQAKPRQPAGTKPAERTR